MFLQPECNFRPIHSRTLIWFWVCFIDFTSYASRVQWNLYFVKNSLQFVWHTYIWVFEIENSSTVFHKFTVVFTFPSELEATKLQFMFECENMHKKCFLIIDIANSWRVGKCENLQSPKINIEHKNPSSTAWRTKWNTQTVFYAFDSIFAWCFLDWPREKKITEKIFRISFFFQFNDILVPDRWHIVVLNYFDTCYLSLLQNVSQRLDLKLEEDSIFYRLGSYGLISFSDYIFLLTVLSSEYLNLKCLLKLDSSLWKTDFLFFSIRELRQTGSTFSH